MSDTETSIVDRRWVAFGPAGAVGAIHQRADGYSVKLVGDDDYRGTFPTLDVAKSALHAALVPGSDRPEFREH
ncbi:methyltransferase [Protaetiibacter larvae]|uniref:Methyltransferase n=1 Tax=Protaetiibacter larvae TaxID=2592654 RepID=A0A5C1Y8W2_9MICO|nr:methyltransferase [Protaetiibacter larvae]QEO09675.1 methyltransferase [Protaetiibacter larvae]